MSICAVFPTVLVRYSGVSTVGSKVRVRTERTLSIVTWPQYGATARAGCSLDGVFRTFARNSSMFEHGCLLYTICYIRLCHLQDFLYRSCSLALYDVVNMGTLRVVRGSVHYRVLYHPYPPTLCDPHTLSGQSLINAPFNQLTSTRGSS